MLDAARAELRASVEMRPKSQNSDTLDRDGGLSSRRAEAREREFRERGNDQWDGVTRRLRGEG